MAVLELKLILALSLREFTIDSAYDEWDKMNSPKGPKTANGHRA